MVLWSLLQRRLLRCGFKAIDRLGQPAGNYTGCSGSHCGTKPFSGELLSTKSMFLVVVLQLTRTVKQNETIEVKRQSQQIQRLSQNYGLQWIRSLFSFGRWQCLCAEFYGMNGASIMESCAKVCGLLRLVGLLQWKISNLYRKDDFCHWLTQ